MHADLSPPPATPAEHRRPRVQHILSEALRMPLCVVAAAAGYGKTAAAREYWHAFDGPKAWAGAGEGLEERLRRAAARAWPAAPAGLLVIDLEETRPDDPCWHAVVACADTMPPAARLLLLCRELPAGLATRWRSRGRLRRVDHRDLALDAGEWCAAGFEGEERRRALLGWWGAALAAGDAADDARGVDDWVGDVWWPTLDAERRSALGRLSLLPDWPPGAFRALFGDEAGDLDALRGSAAAGGVVEDGADALAPLFRRAVARSWRREQPAAWTDAVGRVLDHCLARGAASAAAGLAAEAGIGSERVLAAAGWQLLYGAGRDRLAALLEADAGDTAQRLLRHAWQVEVDKTSHHADAPLRALLPSLAGEQRGQAQALLASIALDYDDPAAAERLARAALEDFDGDRAPASIRARLTLGCTLNVLGRLDEAETELRLAQACAERDRLPRLQLEGLQRRAHLAHVRGRRDEALNWLRMALAFAAGEALQQTAAADSCRRLLAWMHLDALETDAASRLIAEPGFWGFPQTLFQAALALAQDDTAAAAQALAAVEQARETRFLPLKWRNEAAFVESWHAAGRGDGERLLAVERELASGGGAGFAAVQRRILLAGVRLLRAGDEDEDACRALLDGLLRQGAHGQARPLALVLALRGGDSAGLAACLRDSAAAGSLLHWLWLAPCAAGPLAAVLDEPDRVREPAVFDCGRRLLQRLLAPVDAAPAAAAGLAGLTPKETQILRLIGQHYSNEQIAAGLFVSLATVKTHINHLYGKLGIGNRREAIQRARQLFG